MKSLLRSYVLRIGKRNVSKDLEKRRTSSKVFCINRNAVNGSFLIFLCKASM